MIDDVQIVPIQKTKYRVKWGNLISFLLIVGLAIVSPILYLRDSDKDDYIHAQEQKYRHDISAAEARIVELALSNETSGNEIDELKKTVALGQFVQSLQDEFRVSGMYFDPDIVKIIIDKTSTSQYDLDLIFALIYQESKFRAKTRSRVAYGLMQVYFWVWKKEFDIPSKAALYDPAYNMDLGLKILDIYYAQTGGDIQKTLFLYNNGGSGKYNNRRYPRRILRNHVPRFKKIIEKHGGQKAIYDSIL